VVIQNKIVKDLLGSTHEKPDLSEAGLAINSQAPREKAEKFDKISQIDFLETLTESGRCTQTRRLGIGRVPKPLGAGKEALPSKAAHCYPLKLGFRSQNHGWDKIATCHC
jgi:hypothetical protein